MTKHTKIKVLAMMLGVEMIINKLYWNNVYNIEVIDKLQYAMWLAIDTSKLKNVERKWEEEIFEIFMNYCIEQRRSSIQKMLTIQ